VERSSSRAGLSLPPWINTFSRRTETSRLHFYEKVIKVKADVAALHIFPSDINDAALGGVESCQGRPFLAFISTLDRSPRHYIIERRTKRNAVQLSLVP
jgi:hypothetical protein